MTQNDFETQCLNIRRLIVETAFKCGQAAHIGGSMSMVELMNALFSGFLTHRPNDPTWEDRDLFILSKGHAALGYFAVLHHQGYFDEATLHSFQQNGSDLIAHPVKKPALGIESSNGSLGQGLSFGLGCATAMKKRGEDRNVFVMMGDGECNEGSVWETASVASEFGTDNLIAIVDQNGHRNDGATSSYGGRVVLADIWKSFGWNVLPVDGHNKEQIFAAFETALATKRAPSVIVANTLKGRGISFMEDNNDWHHNRITASTFEQCIQELEGDL